MVSINAWQTSLWPLPVSVRSIPRQGSSGLRFSGYRHNTVQGGVPGAVDRPLTAGGYPLEYLVSTYALEHLDLFMDHKRLK